MLEQVDPITQIFLVSVSCRNTEEGALELVNLYLKRR